MKTKCKKVLSGLLAVMMVFSMFAAMPITAYAANRSVTISRSDYVNAIQTKIQNAINNSNSGDTVTVTGANLDQVGDTLNLNIKAGVTVVWKIAYGCPIDIDCLVNLTGDGTFEVAQGGSVMIHDYGTAIKGGSGNTVIVSGGTVSTGKGTGKCYAIDARYVKVLSGKVSAAGSDYAITARVVEVSGGIVEAEGTGGAITALTVEVSGGAVKSINGGAIHGDSLGAIRISGGTVEATGTGDAIISDSSVEVSGGMVRAAKGHAVYAMSTSATVAVSGSGMVSAGDAKPAIYSRHIDVSSRGIVEATGSGNAINSMGKFSSVSVHGGVVSAGTGKAIWTDDDNTVTLSGGFVFAYGTDISEFGDVFVMFSGSPIYTGGVACAWNKGAGNTKYNAGTTNDLYFNPSGSVQWRNSGAIGGIRYSSNAGVGFFPINGVTVTASASMDNFLPVNTYVPDQFTDVDESAWYGLKQLKTIAYVYEYGLMQGKSANTFDPAGNITVAEAITVAARVHSIYMMGGEYIPVSNGVWYQEFVNYAITNGIITANSFTDYMRPATRAEMAYIFSRALPAAGFPAQNTVNSLPDVSSSTPYYDAIITLYKAGVLAGNDAQGTFNPNANIIRAEAAAIISRVILPDTRFSGKTF